MTVFRCISCAMLRLVVIWFLPALVSCGKQGVGTFFQGHDIRMEANSISASEGVKSLKMCEDVLENANEGVVHLNAGGLLADLVDTSAVKGIDLKSFFETPQAGVTILDRNIKVVIDTGFGLFAVENIIALNFLTSGNTWIEGREIVPLNTRYLRGAIVYARPQVKSLHCLKQQVDEFEKQFESMGFKLEDGKRKRTWEEIISILSEGRTEERLRTYSYSNWFQGDIELKIGVTGAQAPVYAKNNEGPLYNLQITIWNKKMESIL